MFLGLVPGAGRGCRARSSIRHLVPRRLPPTRPRSRATPPPGARRAPRSVRLCVRSRPSGVRGRAGRVGLPVSPPTTALGCGALGGPGVGLARAAGCMPRARAARSRNLRSYAPRTSRFRLLARYTGGRTTSRGIRAAVLLREVCGRPYYFATWGVSVTGVIGEMRRSADGARRDCRSPHVASCVVGRGGATRRTANPGARACGAPQQERGTRAPASPAAPGRAEVRDGAGDDAHLRGRAGRVRATVAGLAGGPEERGSGW